MLARNTRVAEVGHANRAFARDVLEGLLSRPRAIPARWFYDASGSQLFEQITELPEYYLTRTERAILARHAAQIAHLTGPGRVVVEFGSGSSAKTPLLLSAISPSAYVPVDIAGNMLRASCMALGRMFPSLRIHPVEGDFTLPLRLPDFGRAPRLGFFPGSTIGNLVAPAAVDLLRSFAAALGRDAQLLIGVDRINDPDIVLPTYDDAQGVTAAFNLNLLARINRELDGTIPVHRFRHVARWNDLEARIEMHLEAKVDVTFRVCGHEFRIRAGETIHTENSIKYGARDARVLLRAGGWSPLAEWVDEEQRFAVILSAVSAAGTAP
jgi:dimethylhistidine N-methyltransferase